MKVLVPTTKLGKWRLAATALELELCFHDGEKLPGGGGALRCSDL
jgi:hypothetical protein